MALSQKNVQWTSSRTSAGGNDGGQNRLIVAPKVVERPITPLKTK